MHYEGNIIRPPSEAESILLQVTLGCSHNQCTFCGTYRGKRFDIKDDETILQDILFAKEHMQDYRRLFLVDGDALIIPYKRLKWIFDQINLHLPFIKRIGLYANAKSIRKKTDEQLAQLVSQGLQIVYMGVESGDNHVLKDIKKGADAAELEKQGIRIKNAGAKLSVTVLLGIAGTEGSLKHGRLTGDLLSKIDPHYIGALTVMLIPGTPLYEQVQNMSIKIPKPLEIMKELREMFAHTHISHGLFFANHASNYLPIRAKMPTDRETTLQLIDQALKGQVELKPEFLRGL